MTPYSEPSDPDELSFVCSADPDHVQDRLSSILGVCKICGSPFVLSDEFDVRTASPEWKARYGVP